MGRVVIAVLFTLLCSTGCVEKSRRVSKTDKELVAQIVSDQKPVPEHPLDIRFETKVRLLGYDLSHASVAPGQTFTVTWYWQVDRKLGEGWKVFTHVSDESGKGRLNMDANRMVRDVYPATRWQSGDYIKDVQEITLPDDWGSGKAIFFMGFWNGPHRLHITKGSHDEDNRARTLELAVGKAGRAPPQPKLPRLVARRVTGSITLDGKLDEPDWDKTQQTESFVNTMTGGQGSLPVTARVLYDESHLYVGYQVQDDYIYASHTAHDDHLWEQDTVELMVDPDGDGKNYFEIQVAPSEVVFDTRYDSRRRPRPFGDVAWQSETRGKVALRGTLNDDEDDEGYSVEMAVPWTAFKHGPTPAEPPATGAAFRVNFFVMDKREKGQRAVGWSPPLVGDFHTLNRFGRLVFPQAAVPTGPSTTTQAPEPGATAVPAEP